MDLYDSEGNLVPVVEAKPTFWQKIGGGSLMIAALFHAVLLVIGIWLLTEATGILALSSAASYASWIDGFFPGETNPSIIGAAADPDQDGIENGVELLIGGNPKLGMDTALLPTLELDRKSVV